MITFQYAMFIAGVILLIICLYKYKYDVVAYMPSMPRMPSMQPAAAAAPPSTSRMTDKQLHEKFIDYKQERAADGDDGDMEPYDPAADNLDKSVYKSHNEFVDESYISTQGPNSSNVERDDTNEVVKRWGLRRVDYEGAFSGADARVVSSEYPDQMPHESSFVL